MYYFLSTPSVDFIGFHISLFFKPHPESLCPGITGKFDISSIIFSLFLPLFIIFSPICYYLKAFLASLVSPHGVLSIVSLPTIPARTISTGSSSS